MVEDQTWKNSKNNSKCNAGKTRTVATSCLAWKLDAIIDFATTCANWQKVDSWKDNELELTRSLIDDGFKIRNFSDLWRLHFRLLYPATTTQSNQWQHQGKKERPSHSYLVPRLSIFLLSNSFASSVRYTGSIVFPCSKKSEKRVTKARRHKW